MYADLKAQEIRGMATYATEEPSENWSPMFWKKFSKWSDELAAYERQEHAEQLAARRAPAAPAEGGAN
jgi:hypothetical protein